MQISDLLEHVHRGQKRKGGEPYTSHLYAVCDILKNEGIKEKTVLDTALLHDILEDSSISKEYLALKFGDRVADIVEFLTKNIAWNTAYCRTKSNLDEMEMIWGEYPEAVIIKMADRLHNLRTISGFSLPKQHDYLTETTECLLPLFTKILKKIQVGYFKKYMRGLLTKLKHESRSITKHLTTTYGDQH